jgi:predicted dehydrogenase
MCEREDIDVVCVCTPSGAHKEPAVAAAKAGKHVVVEKPIEVTLPRADAVIRACDKAGVKLVTIFPSRFSETSLLLKKAIDAGRFGRITVGDCYNKWFRSQEYYDSGGWRGTWELDGGGAAMNQAIHAVDLIQWFMGPVASVHCFTDCLAHKRIEVEDTLVASIRYESGALGVIEAATAVFPGMPRRIEIHGDQGSVCLEGGITLWEFAKKSPADARIRKKFAPVTDAKRYGVADPRDITHYAHGLQIKDLLKVLEKGGEVACDGREGRKSVEIILAMYKSAKTGKPVKLPLKR